MAGPRRLKLDETKKGLILAMLSVGGSRKAAAGYVGCSPTTIRRTAARDPEFAERLRRAESKSEINYLTRIDEAAKKPQYWRAAAWVLERRNPDQYALRDPAVMTVEQTQRALVQFAEILVTEIADAECRERVMGRLAGLAASLCLAPAEKPTNAS